MSKLVLEKRILGIGTEFVIFNQENVAWLETFCFGAKNSQNQVFVEYKYESRKLWINLDFIILLNTYYYNYVTYPQYICKYTG